VDSQGKAVANASISIKNDATGAITKTTADANGNYSVSGLATGKYTVTATGKGFGETVESNIQLAEGQSLQKSLTLNVSTLTQEITVNATSDSLAVKEAPSGGFLEERTPQSIISPTFIQNFTSPIADYAELVNIVPGAYSVNSNGVGLGQAKTYFRGFPDGDYDIDFDGIPFYDTNTPTHHSWAFFPSPEIGSVDFERGPGTAASIGPTPFGGGIHLFSRNLPSEQNIRGNFAYGSFGTQLYDASFDSGNFGPDGRNNVYIDVQRMQSNGYETFNNQEHDAGALKYQHKLGDRTVITGYSGVDHLNANTPNFNGPTRAQIALYGNNFLLTNNSDPGNYTDYQYNFYKVPTDFEYIGVKTTPATNWLIDGKAYTYDYYNGQHYASAPSNTTGCTGISPCLAEPYCETIVVKKGVGAIPCGVDKLNSYRKAGGTLNVNYTAKKFTIRTGVWYEWAHTWRYQWPSDPLKNWTDQTLPNFAEEFWTETVQPFGEIEYRPIARLGITAGVKSYYTSLQTQQYSDDGKTIGTLPYSPTNTYGVGAGLPYIRNYASWNKWLPSLDANYRIKNWWSAYGQTSQGAIVPPSSVFDVPYTQTITVNLKEQLATTYQGGTSVKTRNFSLDADYYLTRFQGSYAAINAPNGDTVYYLQPDSTTKGFEGETTYNIGNGFSIYLNGTVGSAIYRGTQHLQFVAPNATTTPQLINAYVPVPSGLWVANTPGNTEDVGITYSAHGFDVNLNDKRVGDQWLDNSNSATLTATDASSTPANATYSVAGIVYHNQNSIGAIKTANFFINYTIRGGHRFDNTKIRLSINNLLNQQNIFNVATNTNSTVPSQTSGFAYGSSGLSGANPFFGTTAVSSSDVVQTLPGRSVMMSLTFGFSPHNKK